MNNKQRIRARAIFGIFAVGALGLIAALYWTQIIKGASYSVKSNQQYVKPQASLFDRGSIFFESKDGTKAGAASLGGGFLVYMDPKMITDPSQTYEALSQYLKLNKADFILRASKPGDLYEELSHKVDQTTAQAISGLRLQGVSVTAENWRSYPGGTLAAQELGIIGEGDDKTVQGRYGLERVYESVLTRQGIGSNVNIFAQIFSGLRDSVLGGKKTEGDIVTTIEPVVQDYLEKVLVKTDSAWHPDEIGGIIMDPHTGEIIGMASWPTFDPNDVSDVKNASIFSNPLVEHVYEMGSIMKPLTMATGFDTGAITASSTYNDTGTMLLSGKKIANYDGNARGITDMQQILSQSLNVGAATVALRVGKSDFAKYFESFGFGQKTGIDQPNEATGIINNLNTGRDVEIATAAYGQGIAVSPIAMTRGLAILANSGILVRPHLVKEIDYLDGSSEIVPVATGTPVLKKKTVDHVTQMLVTVVDDALLHGAIKMDHYSIAAKTGTAQIPDHVNGGYYPDKYLHSFFGYFPAYNPKFIVFLYQIYPKGAEYASATLTNPFSDIVKFLINYYNISPDR